MKQKSMWALIAVLGLSLLANLLFLVNNISQKTAGRICGEAEITKVNQLAEAKDLNIEEVKRLNSQISNKPNNRSDANCVQVSYITNTWLRDMQAIKNDYRQLSELNKLGQRPDLRIEGLRSLPALDQFINNIDSQNYGRG